MNKNTIYKKCLSGKIKQPLQHRQVAFYLKPAYMNPELIPLFLLVLNKFIEDVLTKGISYQFTA